MDKLFRKRRQAFSQTLLGYLRYVFNDHFVIALLFLLGLVLYQYRQLLQHLPKNSLVWIGLSVLLLLASLALGRPASYLLPADRYYLLPQEKAIVKELVKAVWRSIGVWGLVEALLVLFFTPLFLAVGLPILVIIAFAMGLIVLKAVILWHNVSRCISKTGHLNWDLAILAEQARVQNVLKFFALFTTVKGITTSVRKRPYLNIFLRRLSQKPDHLWDQLYWRALLRSGDYLSLTMRLGMLSVLSVWFLADQIYIALGLSLVLNYLLLFQLLALYYHYDYYDMAQLYPVDQSDKISSLKRVLRQLVIGLSVIEALAMFVHNPLAGLALLVANSLLTVGYSYYRGKKFVDE